jgi:aspartate carbamoyltransferase catalytic subunit
VKKGETLIDTARPSTPCGPTYHRGATTRRAPCSLLARKVDCSVVNAGDGAHEHPTQALLDALTIRRSKGRIEG